MIMFTILNEKQKITLIISCFCLSLLMAVLCFFVHKPLATAPLPDGLVANHAHIVGGATTVSVEIVRTQALREKGLSGRVSLDSDKGMLFIFPEPGRYGFWMPDMHFPIDIIWIDANWRIVDIAPSVPADSYPKEFWGKSTSLYTLEVVAGKAAASGWTTGTQLKLIQ